MHPFAKMEFKKKLREKSRECHNQKPQHFPDTKEEDETDNKRPTVTVRSPEWHIATADMQMLRKFSNPIMATNELSFEQFLVLKKNIWAWQSMEHDHLNLNKLSITFQQKDHGEIWWKLAKWFLKNPDF